MDGSVLKFKTLEACQAALDIINESMRQSAIANGLVVTAEGIVGQRNGKPAIDAAKTTTWDKPRAYDDGWVIAQPNPESMQALASSCIGFQSIEDRPGEELPDV